MHRLARLDLFVEIWRLPIFSVWRTVKRSFLCIDLSYRFAKWRSSTVVKVPKKLRPLFEEVRNVHVCRSCRKNSVNSAFATCRSQIPILLDKFEGRVPVVAAWTGLTWLRHSSSNSFLSAFIYRISNSVTLIDFHRSEVCIIAPNINFSKGFSPQAFGMIFRLRKVGRQNRPTVTDRHAKVGDAGIEIILKTG